MKTAAFSSARWTVGARLSRALIGIGTMAVLARFLSPSDYGIMALILFVTTFAQMLSDFGLRVAVVQRKDVSPLELSSVFWINTAVGMVLTLLVIVFAPQISTLLGAPGLTGPLRQVSPVFLIGTLQGVSMSMLERRFDFRSIAMTDIFGGIAGALAAIVLVFMGYRVGAIVTQQLVFTIVGAVLVIYRARWVPQFVFSWQALKSLLGYGGYVALGSGMQFLSNQMDRPILSRAISPDALGYFAVANQVVLTPILIVVQAVARVLFPMLSSIQDDLARTRAAYLDILHAIMVIMAPICFGLVAVANPFVDVVLGPKWHPVAILIALLSLRGLLVSYSRVNGALLSAQGQAKFQFRWSAFSMVVFVVTLLLAAPHGIEIAISAQLVATLVMAPAYGIMAMRRIKQGWGGVLLAMSRPIVSAIVMCIVVRAVLAAIAVPALVALPVGVALGGCVYVGLMLLVDRKKSLALLRMGLSRRAPA